MEDWEENETRKVPCAVCGHVGLEESDGFFYCQDCGAKADDILLTGVADEDFVDKDGGGALYSARLSRRVPQSTSTPTPAAAQTWFRLTQEEDQFLELEEDEITEKVPVSSFSANEDGVVGPTEPEDFGYPQMKSLGFEDYYNEVRIRYVMGLQWMINMQCEALVERFDVSPLICGVAGTVWLRFLSSSGIFDDNWADNVILDSEIQSPGEQEPRKRKNIIDGDNRKSYARASVLWFRSLKKALPLSSILAITFLACHVAREPVLPTDIMEWSLEGKLPYFAAHVEIARRFGGPSPACPISSSSMFRPYHTSSAQNIECMSARISDAIGLHLPPVNFYSIASRFISQLSLPVEKILSHACRLYEWSSPPELWLSANELRLPSRVCVLSVLIVSIRVIYDINGFGAWEKSLSPSISPPSSHHENQFCSVSDEMENSSEKCSYSPLKMNNATDEMLDTSRSSRHSELDSEWLLNCLQVAHSKTSQPSEYKTDLRSYLQYCRDVVFAGCGHSHVGIKEEELEERLWDFYLNKEDSYVDDVQRSPFSVYKKSKLMADNYDYLSGSKEVKHDCFEERKTNERGEPSQATPMVKAVELLKLEMEEDRFCYIPPRVNVKRLDYLHYARKKDDGALTYAAHADYYILLRACARLAQPVAKVRSDFRVMFVHRKPFQSFMAISRWIITTQ